MARSGGAGGDAEVSGQQLSLEENGTWEKALCAVGGWRVPEAGFGLKIGLYSADGVHLGSIASRRAELLSFVHNEAGKGKPDKTEIARGW